MILRFNIKETISILSNIKQNRYKNNEINEIIKRLEVLGERNTIKIINSEIIVDDQALIRLNGSEQAIKIMINTMYGMRAKRYKGNFIDVEFARQVT